MASNLMWLLYLADVTSNIQMTAAIVLVFAAVAAVCMLPVMYDEGRKIPRFVVLSVAAVVSVAAFAPSKQTIYAAAAIYVAGEFADTEEMQLVRKIITNELREMAEGRKDR